MSPVIESVADLIHEEVCTRIRPCGYPGNRHGAYYQDRARNIYEKLEPEIGAANVLHAVKVILEEL